MSIYCYKIKCVAVFVAGKGGLYENKRKDYAVVHILCVCDGDSRSNNGNLLDKNGCSGRD